MTVNNSKLISAVFFLGLSGTVMLGTTVLTGCSKKSSPVASLSDEGESQSSGESNAGVATIDVNQIASECGALADINQKLDQKESEFNLILEGMRKIHLEEVSKLEKKYGSEPNEEQKQEIAALRSKQASEYNVKWQDTRIKLTAIKQQLDEAFLTKVRPLAQSVAKQKNLSVVIRSENVFCLVDQYDITSEVAKVFQQKYPPAKMAPMVEVAEVPSRGGGFVPRK